MPNAEAPEGKLYVCLACGKTSKDRYGFKKISHGWDESCMMNCGLFDKDQLVLANGRVVEIKEKTKEKVRETTSQGMSHQCCGNGCRWAGCENQMEKSK